MITVSKGNWRQGAAGISAFVAGAAGLIVAGGISPVAAQQAPAASDQSLETIVVTARRTAENLEDVPVAVQALGSEALTEQRIASQADLQAATPGLTVRETGSSDQLNYALRGQSIDSFSYASPAVVAYFNEVEVGGESATSFFDMDSIQVLKGPQGTLFGRNATGGAVLYGAHKPTSELDGYLNLGYGNYDDREVEGAVNIPLSSAASLRVAGKYQGRDGYQHNLLTNDYDNSVDSRVGRVSLLIAPQDTGFQNITMIQRGLFGGKTGSVKIQNANGVNGAPSTYFDPITNSVQPLITNIANAYPAGVVTTNPLVNSLFNGIGDFLTKQQKIGFWDVYEPQNNDRDGRQMTVTNTTSYDFGNATVKNIYGYNHVLAKENSSIEGAPYGFLIVGGGPGPNNQGYTFGTNQWSDELQVSGKVAAVKYIAGAFASQEETYNRIPLTVTGDLGAPYLGPYAFTVTDKSKAIYGQLTYAITTRLNANAGVRYTWEDVSILQGADSLLAVLNGGNGEQKESKPSWLVGLDYKLTDDLLLYFNQRGSWRTGGFNGTSAASFPNAASFKPETTYDFELGAKYAGDLAGVPTRLNLALYDQHVHDVQRAPYLNISALAGNVNEARVSGLEFDGTVDPVRWLQIGASLAYTDARYTDPRATVAGASFYFGPYADTPRTTGSAYFRVSQNLPDARGELAFRAQIYAQSYFYYSNLANTIVPNCLIPGYSLVNLRAEWNGFIRKNLNLAVYSNNVANKEYYVGGFPLGAVTGSNSAMPGTPRMYGVELDLKF